MVNKKIWGKEKVVEITQYAISFTRERFIERWKLRNDKQIEWEKRNGITHELKRSMKSASGERIAGETENPPPPATQKPLKCTLQQRFTKANDALVTSKLVFYIQR